MRTFYDAMIEMCKIQRDIDKCHGRFTAETNRQHAYARIKFEIKCARAKRDNAEALEMAGWT